MSTTTNVNSEENEPDSSSVSGFNDVDDHSDPDRQADPGEKNGGEFKSSTFTQFAVPLSFSLSARPKSTSVSISKEKNENGNPQIQDQGNFKIKESEESNHLNRLANNTQHESSDPVKVKQNLDQKLHQASPYLEPDWGEKADHDAKYSFEVLKNGTIIGQVPLEGQSFFVFGRLQSCDITLEHPSLSRYHAVVQHSKEVPNHHEKGWYIYDLDSTHGTWVNKRKLKPNQYYRLKVGYVIKFGGSSRLHVLQGPDHDEEEESELSVKEMKQQREKQKKEAELLRQSELQEKQRQQEAEQKALQDQGCSWGIGEDAINTEEENPYSSLVPENESTYIDDPKKALKGFYEREGCDLPDYQFIEMSIGKHKCRLELPVDGPNGEELVAEAVVSGKKKDAVIACALEACRMLDRMGMLRPSQHESRKRKQKNWEVDDFYDSDEDTFLDRTGTIEKKRSIRMKKAGKDEAETYDSLMEKYTKITSRIAEVESQLEKAKAEADALAKEEMDELDAYMFSIKSGAMDTKTRMRLKGELLHLKMEEKHLSKLVNIAKPAVMPTLKAGNSEMAKASESFASRLKSKHLQRLKQRKSAIAPKEQKIDVKPDSFEEEEDDVEDAEEENDHQLNERKDCETISQTNIPSSDKKKLTSSISDKMDVTESSHSPSKQKTHSPQRPIPDSQMTRGPTLPEKPPLSTMKPLKKPHTFSTTQALDTLDRPSSKMPGSKAKYEEHDPDYSVWLPPTEQTGDGRTSLNDKLGY